MSDTDSFLLFSGTSHKGLAENIGKELGVSLGKLNIETFPDGEIGVQILENVRGRDVYVVQSISRDPNLYLVELLVLIDAFKRASARQIVPVLTYFGYGRQDRKGAGRVPITARLVADMLEKAGATQVLTMDLHTEQIQGFFDIPVDNLHARTLFVKKAKSEGLDNCIIVAPDVGSARRARRLSEDLGVELAICDKNRIDAGTIQPGALIGSVEGKDVILFDDICSTGKTLISASKVCKEAGARKIIAAVTHLQTHADILNDSDIDLFWYTDTIPPESSNTADQRGVISTAKYFADAIKCINKGDSLSKLAL